MTKYIRITDTYAINNCNYIDQFLNEDNSFTIAVDETNYEKMKIDLSEILSNQDDYDNVYDSMMQVITDNNGEIIDEDCELEW